MRILPLIMLLALLAGCIDPFAGPVNVVVNPAGTPVAVSIGGAEPTVSVSTLAPLPVEPVSVTETPGPAAPTVAPAAPTVAPTATPGSPPAYERIFVPVDRFSTLLPGLTMDELRGIWTGEAPSPEFTSVYASDDSLVDLEALLGPPGPDVKPQPASQVADKLWSDPLGLGILPFEALTPRVRALAVDGLSVTDNRLDQAQWPLAARGQLDASAPEAERALPPVAGQAAVSNRDPSKLTMLVMTGVTAITRGTGAAIEKSGDPAFPAEVVGPELAAADLTSTSNEVSFTDNCVADNRSGVMSFCSNTAWFATLELSGIDLVGLTGNHLNDFGREAFSQTLTLYTERGIKFYGGGRNDEAARAPLIVEDHGNRLAFLGANMFGPDSDFAGPDTPGSARYDRAQMIATVQQIKPTVDLVFAELQWAETGANGDYQVEPLLDQVRDFQALSDAGADVVTGAQAHAPQSMELRGDRLILYGLGNLYFDQTWSWPTRTGIVARYTIYAGHLLNVELLVTVIDDNMQIRWATPEERIQVLTSLYTPSGW